MVGLYQRIRNYFRKKSEPTSVKTTKTSQQAVADVLSGKGLSDSSNKLMRDIGTSDSSGATSPYRSSGKRAGVSSSVKSPYGSTIEDIKASQQTGSDTLQQKQSQLQNDVLKSYRASEMPSVTYEPISSVSEYKEEPKEFSNLYGLGEEITETEQMLLTKSGRGKAGITTGAMLFGLGFSKPFVETGEMVVNPKQALVSVTTTIKNPVGTMGSIVDEFQKEFKYNPIGATGELLGNIALLKSPEIVKKGVVKTSDIVRTRGLTEIESSKIIAPEYPAQSYPKIAKGQTAGQLVEEFKPLLPKETKPAGFTASPKPFETETIAGVGSSELPGVYQAPKLSPKFLRVTAEQEKTFSLSLTGETLRPSAMRITPSSYELVSGVESGQKSIASLKSAKKFFKEDAELGKAYVPFVKTEKEAIITAGTPLKQTRKGFYFKFEGRRIPIYEFETSVKGIKTGFTGKTGLTTTGEISKSLSSYGVGKYAKYSPLDVSAGASLISSYRGKKPSYSGLISKSFNYYKPSKVSYSPPIYIGQIPSPPPSYRGGYSSKGLASSIYYPTTNLYSPSPQKRKIKLPTIGAPDLIPSVRAKRGFKRTPSYGALTLGQLGFKQPKFSKALEQTGLVGRAYTGKVKLGAVGPFNVKFKMSKLNF